ncbi:MAG: hypothetical protein FWH33_00480 [Oscillospiraceae bacterium]|nr:hypothetical protein [Oscillospiraceae bacterium]
MKAEYSVDDFKHAIKNPYYSKLNKEVVVAVRHDVYDIFCEIGKQNGVEPEIIMNRCLSSYAKRLKEHDE